MFSREVPNLVRNSSWFFELFLYCPWFFLSTGKNSHCAQEFSRPPRESILLIKKKLHHSSLSPVFRDVLSFDVDSVVMSVTPLCPTDNATSEVVRLLISFGIYWLHGVMFAATLSILAGNSNKRLFSHLKGEWRAPCMRPVPDDIKDFGRMFFGRCNLSNFKFSCYDSSWSNLINILHDIKRNRPNFFLVLPWFLELFFLFFTLPAYNATS